MTNIYDRSPSPMIHHCTGCGADIDINNDLHYNDWTSSSRCCLAKVARGHLPADQVKYIPFSEEAHA